MKKHFSAQRTSSVKNPPFSLFLLSSAAAVWPPPRPASAWAFPSAEASCLSPAEKILTLLCNKLALSPVMRLGINTFLFTSPFTNDSTNLFKQFKRWGFETVEIPVEDPSHIDPKYVQVELEKNGLVCGSVCACMGPDRDLRGTPEAQETGKKYLLTLIDQPADLGHATMIGPVY